MATRSRTIPTNNTWRARAPSRSAGCISFIGSLYSLQYSPGITAADSLAMHYGRAAYAGIGRNIACKIQTLTKNRADA